MAYFDIQKAKQFWQDAWLSSNTSRSSTGKVRQGSSSQVFIASSLFITIRINNCKISAACAYGMLTSWGGEFVQYKNKIQGRWKLTSTSQKKCRGVAWVFGDGVEKSPSKADIHEGCGEKREGWGQQLESLRKCGSTAQQARNLVIEDKEKAEMRSAFFGSVFTGQICLLTYQDLKANVEVYGRWILTVDDG